MLALQIILAHLVGDYIIQSNWMATEKTKRWWPAIAHALTYTIPYALITQSPLALLVIASTHAVIDHYRLARHLIWAKNNFLSSYPHRTRWRDCDATGYPPSTPIWLATWLMIITDNTVHLLINTGAILWL